MIDFNFKYPGYSPPGNLDIKFNFLKPGLKILAGTSQSFVAVWADPTANIMTDKLYVASSGPGAALSVVDLANERLIDSYLIDKAGNYGELLESEDVVDINISSAGA